MEAVTNVARHGAARKVSVEVAHHDAELMVTVRDDGRSGGTWTPGIGLTGMRERAEELGGTFSAGPTPAGGLVRATYPLGNLAMTTIVLADDHPVVRQGLRAVLDGTEDIDVVGETETGTGAVRLCVELRPDVVLMDLQMPGMHGIDATGQVRQASPETAVLVLTMFDDDQSVFAAVAAGAAGYLLKGSDGADIVAAVRAAAAGHAVFGAALAKRLQAWFRRPPVDTEKPFPMLTDRERDILDGIAAGRTNSEIGAVLFLSPKTVANHVTSILTKLQVAHRAEAIVRARNAGLGGHE